MKTWLACTVVMLTGLIAVGLWFTPERDLLPRTAGSPSAGYEWLPGAEQSYRLSIVSNVRLQLPGTEAPQFLVQRLSGTLNMRVFDRDGEQVRVGFQLSPVSYTLNNFPDDVLQQGLSAPFVVLFDHTGRPVSFRFPEELQNTERILLEESIRTFQVVLPQQDRDSWTTAEEHATGHYLAHYRVLKDGGISKKKTLYTEVNLPSGGDGSAQAPKAELRESAAQIRLASGMAWLRSATMTEAVVFTGGPGFATETSVRATLESVPVTYDSELNALFAAWDEEELLRDLAVATIEPVVEAKALDALGEIDSGASTVAPGERLTGLIEQLNGGEKSGRIALLKEIERALNGNPELAFTLIELIQGQGITGATDAWLIHILERSGTPQAQEALVMVMDDPAYRDWNRIRAIVALGGVAEPSDEAIASLLNISRVREGVYSDEMANAALLAVGSIGKTLSATEAFRADRIRQELVMSLQSADDFEQTGMVLKAMANMGDPDLGDTIIPYLRDESPFVRGTAARALSRVRSPMAVELLTEQLSIDQSRQVRADIISSMENLGRATPRSVNTVRGMVLKEPDAGARYHMTKYLADNLDDHPENKRTLQILALKDRSSRVRKQAMTVLISNQQE